ncbi:MAG TPA: ABC-2 transporter permease [Candidatus Blautia faecavium]|uniref:ABC-2 transporter permease n=1 Tax=Candidatus Blautia faecavium TaxID=2838487 RepID=A0A9D2RX69_9FIRM|nr:ABC-2 transporter permease [Candidatus Blautia faecavium]
MSNILKVTKLDFSLVKPYLKVIGFTMLLPIAFTAINRSITTGVSFAMCFIAMTTGYPFSITEKNSMERLLRILPIKKGELVIGRYLFVLTLGILALTVSLVTHPIVLGVMGEAVRSEDLIEAAAGGLFLFTLYTVFQIPGYYKYGSIKGRVFMYIPAAGFIVTLFLLPKLPANHPMLTRIEESPALVIALLFVCVIFMYLVSIWVSIKILKNKEM